MRGGYQGGSSQRGNRSSGSGHANPSGNNYYQGQSANGNASGNGNSNSNRSNRRPRNFGTNDQHPYPSGNALSSFGNLSVRDRQSSGDGSGGGVVSSKKHLRHLPAELRPDAGLPRRPFLHIVVLFASDPRVMSYSNTVANMFRAAGVDVWLMTELAKTKGSHSHSHSHNHSHGNNDGSYQQGPRWIKPENLVSIITASKADSLIVIGDRNMKNETCQERQAGKLVEVVLSQSIENILKHWSQLTGLRYFKPINIVADLNDDYLLPCLKELTGHCGHARDRLYRLEASANELDEWKRTALRAAGQNERQRRRSSVDAGANPNPDTSQPVISAADQMQVEKLTRSQNAAIKLDSEFREASNIVSNFRLMDADDPRQNSSSVYIDLGLGKGVDLSRYTNYNPPPPEVLSDNATVRFGPIPERIRVALLNAISKFLSKVDKIGETISAVANVVGGVSLWTAYKESLLQSSAGANSRDRAIANGTASTAHFAASTRNAGLGSAKPTPEEQQLVSMGFELPKAKLALKKTDFKVEDALNLLLQGGISDTAVQEQVDDGGWSMTGAAGKLQRQKKKEKQEQERREKQELRQRQKKQREKQLQQKKQAQPTSRPAMQSRGVTEEQVRIPMHNKAGSVPFAAVLQGNAERPLQRHDVNAAQAPRQPQATKADNGQLHGSEVPFASPSVGAPTGTSGSQDVSVPLFDSTFSSFSSFAETEPKAQSAPFDGSAWDNSAFEFGSQSKPGIPTIGFESSPWVSSPSSKLFNEDKDTSSFLFTNGLLQENKELESTLPSGSGVDPWKAEGRGHSSSLDELVAAARSSALQAGAQEFVPSFQKKQTDDTGEFSASHWGVEANGFDPRQHGQQLQHGHGAFAEYGDFSNGRTNDVPYGTDQGFQSFGEDFAPAGEHERDMRVAFQAGVVNASKFRDQASELYNKTEK